VTAVTDDHEQAGFTLVEVLVTLVLLGMTVAVLFGSLGQVLDARARLRPYLDQAEQTALTASWLRQTVQAMIPDYDTGKHRFTATANGFSGLTASPLIGPPGTPTAFNWTLKYDPVNDLTDLEYSENPSRTIQVARLYGKGAVFSYYGQDQEWRRTWPPPDLDQSKTSVQLPQLVRLGGLPRELFPTIVAAPRAAPMPRPLPPGLLGATLLQN
jgi:prepilin-type N-terminal cleavage/methylation domain-containing protein